MRQLYIIGAIVGVGAVAAIAVAAVLMTTGDDSPPLEVDSIATATAQPAASRSLAAPAASPTAASPADEPIPWDARVRVQRLSPPAEADALAEGAVHRNGFVFGPEPASFEGVPGGEECGVLSPGTSLRAGDWIVDVDPAAVEPQIVLIPRAPDFDRAAVSGTVPWLIRWVQIDGDRERIHVHEQFTGGLGTAFQTPLLLPDAGTWRGLATYGPNWGCFVLTVESDVVIPWMVSEAESRGSSYPTMAAPPERIAEFEASMVRVRGLGTPARQCVSAAGLQWARSGEFMTRVDQIPARWSAERRGSKVAWIPLNAEDLGPLVVVGAAMDAPLNTYSYREVGQVRSSTPGGEPSGAPFFITSITPPTAGEWLLVGSAEPGNWGCFRVTVGD